MAAESTPTATAYLTARECCGFRRWAAASMEAEQIQTLALFCLLPRVAHLPSSLPAFRHCKDSAPHGTGQLTVLLQTPCSRRRLWPGRDRPRRRPCRDHFAGFLNRPSLSAKLRRRPPTLSSAIRALHRPSVARHRPPSLRLQAFRSPQQACGVSNRCARPSRAMPARAAETEQASRALPPPPAPLRPSVAPPRSDAPPLTPAPPRSPAPTPLAAPAPSAESPRSTAPIRRKVFPLSTAPSPPGATLPTRRWPAWPT